MGDGALKARIRAAVKRACDRRGDSKKHHDACLRDIWQENPADWEWFAEYFENEATRHV